MHTDYRHVWIADDDTDDAELLSEILTIKFPRITVSRFENGRDLLQKISKKETDLPDLIFMDINMPLMRGPECSRELKKSEQWKSVPVVAVSTGCLKADVDEMYNAGALLYIQKPGDFLTYIRLVENTFYLLPLAKMRRDRNNFFVRGK